MGNNTFFDTDLTGFPGQYDTLFRRRVPRCENDIRLGANFHDPHDFRQNLSLVVQYRDSFFFAMIADILINGVLRRHPDATAAVTGHIHSLFRHEHVYLIPVYAVHAQAAEHLETGQLLTNQISPVMATEIVGLEPHGLVTGITCRTGKLQFIAQPDFGVRGGVQVNVADTAQQLVGFG